MSVYILTFWLNHSWKTAALSDEFFEFKLQKPNATAWPDLGAFTRQ